MDQPDVKKNIVAYFQSGLHCAEAVVKAVLESFSRAEEAAIVSRAASGFGGGIAGSQEELCGAFTGGVMALSALLGRSQGGQDLRECAKRTAAFKEEFQERFESLNCGQLMEGFSQSREAYACVRLTAEAGRMVVAALRQAEKDSGFEFKPGQDLPREKVALGTCPFSCGTCSN
ncbi:MAG: C-GCAxxG-C-C family protein [Thermodesulfobacteriota bacterium]